MTRRPGTLLALLVAAALAVASCSGESRTQEAFCDELVRITGPEGSEVLFTPGNPDRLDSLVAELQSLHDRAPDDISTTTANLQDFFDSYRRAPRDERRDLLAENEQLMIDASSTLDDYALDQCGLLLQRSAPTPVPTAAAAPEVQSD